MKRFLPLLVWLCACGKATPSDDPADYAVDTKKTYTLTASAPRYMVPSPRLPKQAKTQASNNNVDIIFHDGRLFMAWRTAPQHFASPLTEIHIVSSVDDGETWVYETSIKLGSDIREPRFLSFAGKLTMHFFQAGTSPVAFEPKHMWRIVRNKLGSWSAPEIVGEPGEIPWAMKTRNRTAYFTTYIGNHYGTGPSNLGVFFWQSKDGVTFTSNAPDGVYRGGVSEVAFEFDADGNMWMVTRNEDGDASGFGSQVCFAAKADLWKWDCPAQSLPEIYESPALFRHGNEIYLVARRDIGGPFDQKRTDLTTDQQRLVYQQQFSLRPKRTAVYRVLQKERDVEFMFDLPSAGDTAFASVRRTGAHSFLVANYTSPVESPDLSWIEGQTDERGTQIYFTTLTFK